MKPPKFVEEVAEQHYQNKTINCDHDEDSFVFQPSLGKCTFVGVRLRGSVWMVAKMWNEYEITNQGSTRINTTESRHLKCKFYRMSLGDIQNSDDWIMGTLADRIDNGDYQVVKRTAYINGHRLPPFEVRLNEAFIDE